MKAEAGVGKKLATLASKLGLTVSREDAVTNAEGRDAYGLVQGTNVRLATKGRTAAQQDWALAHEIGHVLTRRVGVDPVNPSEAQAILDATREVRRSVDSMEAGELPADLFRLYLHDPEQARRVAPQSTKALEAALAKTNFSELTQEGKPEGKSEGPGAAEATDKTAFSPPEPTGLKHASVAKEREKLGLPPREKMGTVKDDTLIDAAVQRKLEDSTTGYRLVETLKARPRGVEADETADLLVHQRSMLNERSRLEDAIVEADKKGEDAEYLRDQLAATNKGLEDVFDVTEKAGSLQGLAFRARRWMMNEGYTLAEMERSYKAAKGEDLTGEERKRLVDISEKIKSAQNQLKGITDQLAEGVRRRKLETETNQSRKDAATKAYRDSVNGEKQDWGGLRDRLGEGLKGAGDNADSWIREIFKSFVGEGLEKGESHTPENREKYLTQTHDLVKSVLPDIEKQSVSDAITGYGDFKRLSREEIDVQTRQYRGELRELSKLSDVVDKQQAPKKTGMERQTPSDEERGISKRVREEMKRLGINTADPETQLKTALQSRKTYYENRINDLQLEIAKREKNVPTKGPQPTDAALDALKKEYADVKKEHEAIFGKPGMTDAERLQAAIKGAERADAENQRRIREGDIFDAAKKTLTSPELDAAKAKAEASAATLNHLRDLARGQEFTPGSRAEAERIAEAAAHPPEPAEEAKGSNGARTRK